MATMTFSTLTQDLKDWMENDGTEFGNETNNFISLAEQRIARDIDPYAFHEAVNSTFNVGDRFVSKPADAKIIFHFLLINSSSQRVFLEKRTDEFIYDYWKNSATTGTPKYWSNYSDTAILVAPTPSAALRIEMTYSRRLAELSSTNTTNWLTENAQDLLLYGCLMEASTFTKRSTVDRWHLRVPLRKEPAQDGSQAISSVCGGVPRWAAGPQPMGRGGPPQQPGAVAAVSPPGSRGSEVVCEENGYGLCA